MSNGVVKISDSSAAEFRGYRFREYCRHTLNPTSNRYRMFNHNPPLALR